MLLIPSREKLEMHSRLTQLQCLFTVHRLQVGREDRIYNEFGPGASQSESRCAIHRFIDTKPETVMDSSRHDSSEYRSQSASHPDTTPSQRQFQRVLAQVKKRVSTAAPNGGRCLVENCSGNRGVEYAHCIPHSFVKEEQLVSAHNLLLPNSSIIMGRCVALSGGGTWDTTR